MRWVKESLRQIAHWGDRLFSNFNTFCDSFDPLEYWRRRRRRRTILLIDEYKLSVAVFFSLLFSSIFFIHLNLYYWFISFFFSNWVRKWSRHPWIGYLSTFHVRSQIFSYYNSIPLMDWLLACVWMSGMIIFCFFIQFI